jgi:phage terminase Nu1 subunit (DNA packaging protein)
MPGLLLTQKQLAAHLGCETRAIEEWVTEGMPVRADGRFSLRAVVAWFEGPQPESRLGALEVRVARLAARVGA